VTCCTWKHTISKEVYDTFQRCKDKFPEDTLQQCSFEIRENRIYWQSKGRNLVQRLGFDKRDVMHYGDIGIILEKLISPVLLGTHIEEFIDRVTEELSQKNAAEQQKVDTTQPEKI